jgi:hypothetical protein
VYEIVNVIPGVFSEYQRQLTHHLVSHDAS